MNTHDLTAATWIKSSYSGSNGGNCVEVSRDFAGAHWIKSTHSGSNGGDCVEVAPGFTGVVPVRDSKNPEGPVLVFPATAWASFLSAVQSGDFPTG